MKDECFADLHPTQEVEKPLESDLADERLFGCLRSVLQHNRNFVPVQTDKVVKLNIVNLQALLRAALKIPPSGKNHDATNFLVAVTEFIADGGCDVSHPATVKVAREHFDYALVKNLAFYGSNERTGKEWCTARREVAKLVLPIDSTDKVMDQQGSAWEILPDLDAVAKSSDVGKKLVWRAQRDAHGGAHQSGGGCHTESAGPGPHPGERQSVQVQLCHELPYSQHRGVGDPQTKRTRLLVPWRQRERVRDELAGALHCCRGVLGADRRCGHRGVEPALLREGPCSARSYWFPGQFTRAWWRRQVLPGLLLRVTWLAWILRKISRTCSRRRASSCSAGTSTTTLRCGSSPSPLVPLACCECRTGSWTSSRPNRSWWTPRGLLAPFQKLHTATVLEFAGIGARSLFNTVVALVKSIAE